jgi:hypothetical protein
VLPAFCARERNQSCCALAAHSLGTQATILSCHPAGAEVLLPAGQEFNLTIVSSSSSEWEGVRILSYANEMPTYMLHGLTLAAEAGSSGAFVSACRVSGGG